MSTQNEITRIKNNIAAAYNAAKDLGATLPDNLNSNNLPATINTITPSDIIKQSDIPDYIKTAAFEVAKKVENVRKSDSVVFMAMSDSHHIGAQSNGWGPLMNKSNLHACMAAKILSYALKVDFNCHLGDFSFGNATTTNADLKQQVGEFSSYLNESYDGIPQFRCVGNHDTGQYNTAEGAVNATLVGKEYLYNAIGKYCEGATYGSTEYGYCYRDFADKKLRVICLNSSEGETLYGSATSYAMSPAQLKWFAQALYDVGSKSDASAWSVMVLSHFPLDFYAYGMYNAAAIVKAYIEGTSITQNGTSFNYSGHNGAKFVAGFHGHVHCFSTSKLHTISNNTGTKFDAWRVAVPNSGYYRQNQYADVTQFGINWGETTTYDKVENTYKDCAFVINVVNPSEQKIYSYCYGAGYDRVIGYAATVYYAVSKSLSNVTASNTTASVESGQPYSVMLTATDGYELSTVKVTMGGTDITSSSYSNGVVNISKVTGNVVITASATKKVNYTNQIPISTDTDGSIFNGVGYQHGVLSSSTGAFTAGSGGGSILMHATGFIPAKLNDTVRFENLTFSANGYGDFTSGNHRICVYDKDKNFLKCINAASSYGLSLVKDDDGTWKEFKITTGTFGNIAIAYMRVACPNIDDTAIITVNEVIE